MGNSNLQDTTSYKSIKREKHSALGLIDFIETSSLAGQRRYTAKLKTYTNHHDFQNSWAKLEKRKGIFQNIENSHILQVHHFA
jgi:hypothetical protein